MLLRTTVLMAACAGCASSVSPVGDSGRSDAPDVSIIDSGRCEPVTLVNSRLGFTVAAPSSAAPAMVVERSQTLLQLQQRDGTRTQFSWRGSDLPFAMGEQVEIVRTNGWDCVRGTMITACVLSESGFVMPSRMSPSTPFADHSARFFATCGFGVTESSGCGTITQTAQAFAVEIRSSSGNVVVQPYNTALLDGIVYANLGIAQWPSAMQNQGGQVCIVEARWSAVVTAIGPSL